MGYFANGVEGDMYDALYCGRCVHYLVDYGCPCRSAHLLWNYDECNKDDSLLHKMIPREGPENKKCIFFEVEAEGRR